MLDKLNSYRRAGESRSDVILSGGGGGVMAEVLGTWAGLDRKIGAVRRWLLDKPEMEPEVLAEVRARLERVLATLVADGRVRIERPRVVDDLRGLLAEIDRRAGARPGAGARQFRLRA